MDAAQGGPFRGPKSSLLKRARRLHSEQLDIFLDLSQAMAAHDFQWEKKEI